MVKSIDTISESARHRQLLVLRRTKSFSSIGPPFRGVENFNEVVHFLLSPRVNYKNRVWKKYTHFQIKMYINAYLGRGRRLLQVSKQIPQFRQTWFCFLGPPIEGPQSIIGLSTMLRIFILLPKQVWWNSRKFQTAVILIKRIKMRTSIHFMYFNSTVHLQYDIQYILT